MKPVRYAYGLTAALLLGGAAVSLATGLPAGAQVAQNEPASITPITPRSGAPASFADLTQQLAPAVVNISTRQRIQVRNVNPFAGTPFEGLFGGPGGPGGGSGTREAQSLGSGFLISSDGYIVTNNHVITADERGAQVESITVTMPDGTEYPAKLIGRDAASDIAVLKINGSKPFPFVKFGDSRNARVGDWVIAIGNPFSLGGTVTAGIISAVYRATGSGSAYDRYLQTDASINRGNSGGPMFDMQGQVIGINNAIFSPTGGSVGIGFAIPAETAEPIVQKLIRGEEIERGYMGVQIQPISEDLANSLGIPHNRGEFVQSVQPGQPAAAAGMRAGDVINKVNGKDVTPDSTVSYLVANIKPGTNVPIEVMRDGKTVRLNVKLGKRPSEEELATSQFGTDEQGSDPFGQPDSDQSQLQGIAAKALGLKVITLTPQIAHQLGIADNVRGVVINAIDPNSDAQGKGLQRGDIILSANYTPVATPDDLDKAIRAAQSAKRDAILLQVQRRGRPAVFLPLRLR